MLDHYIRQLNDLYDGEPWYGDSLLDKLDAFSPEMAFAVPAPGVHSIAQIVAHMLVWRRVLIEHLKGNTQFRPEADSAEDWNPPAKLKSKGWEKLLSELADNQQVLLDLLAAQSEAWLEKPYRDGHTYRYLLEGVIQHDVYHIGQIGLLGKMNRGV
jgi:uncharacterized damage-inducible protein DinB